MREESKHGECYMAVVGSSVWRKLWKLHIPNEIKVFVWRALHDILPTRENLVCRHIVEDSTYELYKRGYDSVLHILWECSVAQDVWVGCSRGLQKCAGGQKDFLQLVEELLNKLPLEEFELFLVQAWL